ncbi:hypothetical protein DFH07DRAFT_576501 [Mycena maculata]|uniref:Rad60/SUMO-like domain-containing protein n=1 Tax=Mycena maculata TaxID=230809 RepID=A0AAD7IPW7_9AGAR|nr:hypothetical protein DFH07DRAFT_576501 [Mycena maculata]
MLFCITLSRFLLIAITATLPRGWAVLYVMLLSIMQWNRRTEKNRRKVPRLHRALFLHFPTAMSQCPNKPISQNSSASSSSVQSLSPAAARERLETGPRRGYIRIQIRYGGNYQLFDMRKNATFACPMERFAEKINQELPFLRFNFEGVPVREEDTPSSLNMSEAEDSGNLVEVTVMQTGGGPSA